MIFSNMVLLVFVKACVFGAFEVGEYKEGTKQPLSTSRGQRAGTRWQPRASSGGG